MNYTIIIPIYNEQDSIHHLLKELSELDNSIQIIIVNDGSYDSSEKLIKNSSNKIDLVSLNKNHGKGYAIREGLKFAINEQIVIIDGDLEISINSLIKFFSYNKKIDHSFALVGVRWSDGLSPLSLSRFVNFLVNYFFNLIYKTNYKDILCCLKVMPKNLIKSLELKSNGFGIETEIMAKLTNKNVLITEIPVSYKSRSRKQGKKIKFYHLFTIIYTMIVNKIID